MKSTTVSLETKSKPLQRCCGNCRHFCNDPAVIEAAFPGLTTMSSAYASVRANDGLCARHDVYLAFTDTCQDFSAK